MDDRHLSLELLRAIHRGERNPGDLATVAMVHLFEKCAQCRLVFETWRREVGQAVEDPRLSQYDDAFDRVRARLRGEGRNTDIPRAASEQEIAAELAAAHDRLRELVALPTNQRSEWIRTQPGRFTGPALADLLLEQSRGHLPSNPQESYALARLARSVLQHGEGTAYETELYARALGYQGNALRAQGDLRTATELIEVGRFLLKSQGGGDRLTQAELDSFEGSLRRAQRQLDAARDLFSRAVMEYAMEGRKVEAAKNLLSLAMVFRELGDMERAVDLTAQASETFQEERAAPALQLYARHNLASMLRRAGATKEARKVFADSRELYESQTHPHMQLRRIWLEGSLAQDDGDLATAETAFRAARDGFLAQGVGYDAALAALDLAVLYAEQGRTADLKRVAEEIIPIFEAQDVHREAAAALMLFQDAVRAEQVTLRYLIELSRYLERARLDPSLAFQRPA